MKRGLRFVRGGEKELVEKLGRNDPCPCGSGHSFQEMLPHIGSVSMAVSGTIIGGNMVGRFGALPGELVHCHRNSNAVITYAGADIDRKNLPKKSAQVTPANFGTYDGFGSMCPYSKVCIRSLCTIFRISSSITLSSSSDNP